MADQSNTQRDSLGGPFPAGYQAIRQSPPKSFENEKDLEGSVKIYPQLHQQQQQLGTIPCVARLNGAI